MYFQVPSNTDTSGSSPHFLLATGGGDNLIKLWNIFTGSGKPGYIFNIVGRQYFKYQKAQQGNIFVLIIVVFLF